MRLGNKTKLNHSMEQQRWDEAYSESIITTLTLMHTHKVCIVWCMFSTQTFSSGKTKGKLRKHLCAPSFLLAITLCLLELSMYLSIPFSFLHHRSIIQMPQSSLRSRPLCFSPSSIQGRKATWLAACCFGLVWSTLHKFHMVYFCKPTSRSDGNAGMTEMPLFWIM